MQQNKYKILYLGDDIRCQSGVGNQGRLLIEQLLSTGKFKFICLAGALQHHDLTPCKIEPYGDDLILIPVNGFGDRNIIRQLLLTEKPDALVFFTDPRFFIWLWECEDEVRSVCPMLYNCIWDNSPTPFYNKQYYDATDYLCCISRKMYGIAQDMGYVDQGKARYIPHAIDSETFKPLSEAECQLYKQNMFGPHKDKKFVVMWNNRNARRKKPGDVIACFAKFAERVGKENVALFMHTQVLDQEGQNLIKVAEAFNIKENMIISESRIEAAELNRIYNATDCMITLSDAEGHGLGVTETLFSGNPIITTFTGGLAYQIGTWADNITDFRNHEELMEYAKKLWKKKDPSVQWWGVPIFPAARTCTGSQQIPYIYSDHVAHEDVVDGLVKLYEMGRTKRRELGLKAREWAMKQFNVDNLKNNWVEVLETEIKKHKEHGVDNLKVEEV